MASCQMFESEEADSDDGRIPPADQAVREPDPAAVAELDSRLQMGRTGDISSYPVTHRFNSVPQEQGSILNKTSLKRCFFFHRNEVMNIYSS